MKHLVAYAANLSIRIVPECGSPKKKRVTWDQVVFEIHPAQEIGGRCPILTNMFEMD